MFVLSRLSFRYSNHSFDNCVASVSSTSRTTLDIPQSSSSASSVRSSSPSPSKHEAAFDEMDLLLSLDVSLELIHANRDAIKRLETFASYPGSYGHRVRDTIEEVFILLLQSMGERHIKPGFDRATEQMRTYKPAEHEETTSVAPLLQFFELVHVGDTIQSMVQVYFDKELVRFSLSSMISKPMLITSEVSAYRQN